MVTARAMTASEALEALKSAVLTEDQEALLARILQSQSAKRRGQRDRLLCLTAACFYPGLSWHAQGALLHDGLARYAASSWKRDRTADECPPHHIGKIQQCYWHVLRANDAVPSARSIRRILELAK
jgi:hypothetical protein